METFLSEPADTSEAESEGDSDVEQSPRDRVTNRLRKYQNRKDGDAIPDAILEVLTKQLLPNMTFDETPTMNCSNQCVTLRWKDFYLTLSTDGEDDLIFVVLHPETSGSRKDVGKILDAWNAVRKLDVANLDRIESPPSRP